VRQKGGENMVNINKLKAKIVESELTVERLALIIGVNKATLYRKINGNGENFTIKEVDSIIKALNILSISEITAIFFTQFVA
jgi:predicted transcriptional regulator